MKNLTVIQRKGLVAVVLGSLMTFFCMLPLFSIGSGNFRMNTGIFFNTFGEGSLDEGLFTFTGVLALLTLLASIALFVFGMLLLIEVNRNYLKAHKVYIILVATASGLAIALFFFAMIFSATYGETTLGIITHSARLTFGTIMLLLVGALGVTSIFVLPRVKWFQGATSDKPKKAKPKKVDKDPVVSE